ncbi:hypothetical protein GBA52_008793 [Prunus armeniaca]|nr:hypothetical protein GBA52_008793 [Prunus armeniaca]
MMTGCSEMRRRMRVSADSATSMEREEGLLEGGPGGEGGVGQGRARGGRCRLSNAVALASLPEEPEELKSGEEEL